MQDDGDWPLFGRSAKLPGSFALFEVSIGGLESGSQFRRLDAKHPMHRTCLRYLWSTQDSSTVVDEVAKLTIREKGHPHHPQITGFTDISIVVNSMPSIYWFSRYSPMTHQNARVQIHHWYKSILLVATMSLRKIILLVYGIALCSHRHINV